MAFNIINALCINIFIGKTMGNAAEYCGECKDNCTGVTNGETGEYRVIANKDYLKIREDIIERRALGTGPRIVC